MDFDGTLYDGDSMLDFARFLNPRQYQRSVLALVWMLPFAWMHRTWRDRMKVGFLRRNFGGIERSTLEEKGREFYTIHKEKCFPKAVDWISTIERGTHEIVIVSGSSHAWLEPFAQAWNIRLLCTTLEFQNERCTGKWLGKNLRGVEKVEAVREHFDLSQYQEVIAFGNARSDRALKEIADRVEINYFR